MTNSILLFTLDVYFVNSNTTVSAEICPLKYLGFSEDKNPLKRSGFCD